MRAIYDIEADDHDLRDITEADDDRVFFDQLRKIYPQRREFHNTTLILPGATPRLKAKLVGIGFRVE